MNRRRFKFRGRQKNKLTLRTLMVAGVIGASFSLAALMFVVNIFEDETAVAENNPMVISNIEAFQDTSSVMQGAVTQVILGIKIRTKGNSNKLNLTGIELSARGTSKYDGQIIENAKLWTSGNDLNFSPSKQLGTTLPIVPSGNFIMSAGTTLQDGDNYYWLTYDIGNSLPGKSLHIDAECINVIIGTLTYEPDRSAPPGHKKVLNNIPYFSSGNGDIASLASWNSSRDGSGSQPLSFSNSDATYNIQAGHILKNSLDACLSALIIERNGVLKSSSTLKAQLLEVHGGGTYIQEKNIKNENALSRFMIRNGGNYIHQNSGNVPGQIKDFEKNSTVILTNYSNETFTKPVIWGNLVFNSENASVTDIASSLTTIKGDLEIRNTGNENYIFTSSSDSINIEGNLVINGGRMILSAKNNQATIKVSEKIIVIKGWLSDHIPGNGSKGSAIIIAGTGFYLKNGVFKMSAPESKIIFSDKNSVWNQAETDVLLSSIDVLPGGNLTLKGKTFGPIKKEGRLKVMKNARLNCEKITIKGEGGFILDDFASLSTSHADGINTNGLKGSIRTSTRVFSSYGDYIFSGDEPQQKSGIFVTRPYENTINNLVLEKYKHSDVLVMEQDLNLKGRLIKERGNINKNNHQINTNVKIQAAMISR